MATRRARDAAPERRDWSDAVHTIAQPLPLTRHRVVRHHKIHGAPWPAHLIEDPRTARVTLYIEGRKVSDHADVDTAMVDVLARATTAHTH